jgi:hypothetical protein
LFQIFQFNSSGSGNHKKLAQVEITLGHLIDGGDQSEFDLTSGGKMWVN